MASDTSYEYNKLVKAADDVIPKVCALLCSEHRSWYQDSSTLWSRPRLAAAVLQDIYSRCEVTGESLAHTLSPGLSTAGTLERKVITASNFDSVYDSHDTQQFIVKLKRLHQPNVTAGISSVIKDVESRLAEQKDFPMSGSSSSILHLLGTRTSASGSDGGGAGAGSSASHHQESVLQLVMEQVITYSAFKCMADDSLRATGDLRAAGCVGEALPNKQVEDVGHLMPLTTASDGSYDYLGSSSGSSSSSSSSSGGTGVVVLTPFLHLTTVTTTGVDPTSECPGLLD